MEVVDYTLQSEELERDFDVTVYGSQGQPAIVFPEGDSTCTSWENAGMIDALQELVDSGAIQLFCIDSLDDEGWYSRSALPEYRLENIRSYLTFAQKDFASFVATHTSSQKKPLLLGAGMGALNATLLLLNDPSQFGGLLALSGNYDVRSFLDDKPNEEWLALSPVDRVPNLKAKEIKALSKLPIAFVCGQHPSEDGIATQRTLEAEFANKGIEATFEYWGFDVSHGWDWWKEEAQQLLPCLLTAGGLKKRKLSAEVAAAKAEVDHVTEVLSANTEQLKEARAARTQATKNKRAAAKRLKEEQSQVAEHAAREQELSQVAQDAWSKRDEAARALDEATRVGNEAQAAADEAKHEREKAEWIAGEAQAAAEQSNSEAHNAAALLEERKAAVADATAAKERADEAYAKAKAALESEQRASKQPE